MALSYSLTIVLEVLLLVSVFSVLLLLQKKTSPLILSKRMLGLITIVLFSGSIILFLGPKINLIQTYEHTKLTVDAWDHYIVTKTWSDTGSIPNFYSYYSTFPITYIPQIVLHQVTDISLFDSMTVHYLLLGIAGLFIVFGIASNIIKGSKSEKLIFAGISGITYSFLQYFNLLFVQQYPVAIGTVAVLFCVYAFVLLARKRKRAIICLCVGGVILAISHPFAPIFVAALFFIHYLTNKTIARSKTDHYQALVSGRIAIFISLIAIVAGMSYSMFAATSMFEHGVGWSERNAKYTFETLSSQFVESTASGVGRTFEGRYQDADTILYALNWAVPASTSASMLLMLLLRKARIEDDEGPTRLLFPLAIVSTGLFVLSFSFSFVEFAFSRYFGAYALAFNIPVTSYLIFRMVKLKSILIRYCVLGIFGLAVISSVTDPTMLPNIRIGDSVLRDSNIYASELDIIAWENFYEYAADDGRLVQTNLNNGPIRHYKEINDYSNEIIINPSNYTVFGRDSYLIIDKTKIDPDIQLNDIPMVDRVYDNSRIYYSK